MIHFFWPYKSVPTWLEDVRFSGIGHSPAIIRHNGFGIVAKVNGKFVVWVIAGNFMHVNSGGRAVEIRGGGHGVRIWASFFGFFADCRALITSQK